MVNNQIIGHLCCSNRQKTHVNGLRVWSSDHPHLQEEVHNSLIPIASLQHIPLIE